MTKRLIFSLLLIAPLFALAQIDSLPLYQQFPELPPLKLNKIPGDKLFTKADLKKKKTTLIVLFNPDCDHCQHAVQDMLANKEKLKKVQIVMSSSASKEMLESFYKDYKLAQMPNLTMGQDIGYFLNTFYGIFRVPAIFMYNKKGMFVKMFDDHATFSGIAAEL